ncbi:MAG: hypothetical protein M3T96_08450 [Acidobacteriota bacterium]|nr:hypothetical protein [Acidobacteriota bacterium]
MNNNPNVNYTVGAVHPVECLKEGWAMIKDQYWLILAICFVGMLLAGIVPFGIIYGPMMCGIYLCLLHKKDYGHVSFETLFKGFDFFLPSFVASLFMLVPAFVLGIMFYIPLIVMQFRMMGKGKPDPGDMAAYFSFFCIGMVILMIVFLILHTLLLFAYPLIVEHKLSGVEAFKTSYRAVFKNFSGIAGLIALHFCLIILGYCLCFVGVYLMLPLMFASSVNAYRHIFPRSNRENFDAPPPPDAYHGAGGYN